MEKILMLMRMLVKAVCERLTSGVFQAMTAQSPFCWVWAIDEPVYYQCGEADKRLRRCIGHVRGHAAGNPEVVLPRHLPQGGKALPLTAS
jgi:hypothetical protein